MYKHIQCPFACLKSYSWPLSTHDCNIQLKQGVPNKMLIYPPDEWSKAKAFHREQQCVGGSAAAVLTTQLDKSFYALVFQFLKKQKNDPRPLKNDHRFLFLLNWGYKYMEKGVKIQRRLHMGFGPIDCVLCSRTNRQQTWHLCSLVASLPLASTAC